MAFQGGFHAFPGGKLDPGEDAPTAAVREVFEEVGVRLDPDALTGVGRWVTPAFSPRRFDTWFFLASCPPGQEPAIITGEHDQGEWIRPADAIAAWINGTALAAPPVLHALRCLAEGLENIQRRMLASPLAHGGSPNAVEMRPGILLVPLRTPTLPPATHTNCYVIGGDEVIVVDPGSPYPDEQATLDAVLERRNVREVWLTHLHRDHVSGAEHLRRTRGIPVAAHRDTARALEGQLAIDRTFADDETVSLAGTPGWRLTIIHTPGHAHGHVCILEERLGSLIAGDLVAGVGTIVIDPPEGDMAAYFASLERVASLPATALFPAHGPVMADSQRHIREYLEHRIARERQILDAWSEGVHDAQAIVWRVYTDVPEAMYQYAERTVLAHLAKLRTEGRLTA